jgi:8-oxo-dGTP pyrophosphatase MutT (NUDIX family)
MIEERWDVLSRKTVFEHPFLRVETEEVRLPDGRIIPDWPKVYMPEFVNAMVLNESGQVMVIEGYKHGVGRSSWQMLGGLIEDGETPLETVKRELLEETGYHSPDWVPLGSHVLAANRHCGTGHFFLARNARQIQAPNHDDLEQFVVKWVALSDLRQALFDGRVAAISYAMNIALGMLMLTPQS